jgi:hypothetical protein
MAVRQRYRTTTPLAGMVPPMILTPAACACAMMFRYPLVGGEGGVWSCCRWSAFKSVGERG